MILITVLAFWGCEKDSTDPGDGGNGNDFVTELEGTWIGNDLTWVFSGSAYSATWTFDISGSEMDIVGPSEWYVGTFSINTQTNPKQLDLVITDCVAPEYIGTTALAIYNIYDNVLTFVGNEPGSTNRPANFTEGRVFILTKQ